MARILDALNRNVERWALLVFYVMLVITMFIEVLRREILSYSSIWGEEIVRYSFIYLAWIGAAAAVRERGHIRIDVLLQYVGRSVKAAALHLWRPGDVRRSRWSRFTGRSKRCIVSAKFGSVTHGLRVSARCGS